MTSWSHFLARIAPALSQIQFVDALRRDYSPVATFKRLTLTFYLRPYPGLPMIFQATPRGI